MQNNIRKCKSIGFAGADSYDLIIYLAVFLKALEREVLLIDKSGRNALSFCIQSPEMLKPDNEVVHFRGLDIVTDSDPAAMRAEYDYILTDFGDLVDHPGLAACNNIFLVTDTKYHNLINIKDMSAVYSDYYLLVRDITAGINERYLPQFLINNGLQGIKNFCIYWDEGDREAMTELQYHHYFVYKRLSPGMKEFLKEVLTEILGFGNVELKYAAKKVRRGR